MAPRAGLYAVENRSSFRLFQESNSDCPVQCQVTVLPMVKR
jgi:hypothetical protein